MMDAVNDERTEKIVFMTSAQIGKTVIIENIIGYYIDLEPSPILFMLPTLEMYEAYSKDRLAPMIRDTPALRNKIRDSKARDSGNTVSHKKFPGGSLNLIGANSPASISSRPIRIFLADEIDRFPDSAGAEGDPLALGEKRTNNFFNRKIILTSTPTVKGHSKVEREYEFSDCQVYLVPCPECGHEQELLFKGLIWDKEKVDGVEHHHPETVKYSCEGCGVLIDESDKPKMLRRGYWKAEAPGRAVAGFRINELYSPWSSWERIVREFLKAKGKPELLKVWVNTTLGETYEERGEAPDWELLQKRAEDYPRGVVQPGGLVLTAAADVQKDRIECEVIAWGRSMENWSVDFLVFEGNPEEESVWHQLDTVLNQEWPQAGGGPPMQVAIMAVDTGYKTQEVYAYARRWAGRVLAVKGRSNLPMPLSTPSYVDLNHKGQKIRKGVKLWSVGVDILKSELYAWLRLKRPAEGEPYPHGYCHFPEYDEEWFQQLTAEELRETKLKSGGVRREWVKARDRNEALDIRVYNRAVASYLGLHRITEEGWLALEKRVTAITDSRPAVKHKTKRRRQRGSRGITL